MKTYAEKQTAKQELRTIYGRVQRARLIDDLVQWTKKNVYCGGYENQYHYPLDDEDLEEIRALFEKTTVQSLMHPLAVTTILLKADFNVDGRSSSRVSEAAKRVVTHCTDLFNPL